MSTVIANMSMSLDGFIEDRDGDVRQHLFGWTSGRQSSTMPGDGREFHTSKASAELLREAMAGIGALVCGRTLFDLTHGWGGQHPTGAPVLVVTHEEPPGWKHPAAPFTFVLEGVRSAVEQAKAVAGNKMGGGPESGPPGRPAETPFPTVSAGPAVPLIRRDRTCRHRCRRRDGTNGCAAVGRSPPHRWGRSWRFATTVQWYRLGTRFRRRGGTVEHP